MTKQTLAISTMLAAAGIAYSQLGAPVRPGDPLPGLTTTETALFDAGKEDFLEVEAPEDGLGPAFNGRSCAECHNAPGIGGIGNLAVTRAGRLEQGRFNEPEGGSLIHKFSNPDHACQPQIPRNANVVATRIPIAIFGDGLIDAIPDAAIRALEDPGDRDGDGVRGRAAIITDAASGQQRVGRFGWKAQQATLLSFAGDAYVNEMGITNDIFRTEVGAGIPFQRLAECDKVPDPEDKRDPVTGRRGVDNFTNFMKMLAPIGRAPGRPESQRGERVFMDIGCATCHRPLLLTGASEIAALRQRPVPLFSDLLLHDIGTGDGIAQAAAGPNDFRTPPLWGLRTRKLLMHDGASLTPEQAIERHRGEATRSRDRFRALPPPDRDALRAFLDTL
jgi:CxxC motif-containing protein (DUF1111 family)